MPKYVVRYGVMRSLGVFSCRARDRYARGQRVIARTGRGQEAGEVLCEATDHALSQMEEEPRTGQILRLLSADDDHEIQKIGEQQASERDICAKHIAALELDMQLVDVERIYGGERVVVYFISENRVDFRELVKLLAKDLQTRVEMRQIGVRDEAKMLADYGDCGKPVCCNTHLSEMPPVSMKMAKLQKATLDPNKISGRCGRLKCCLYDTYQELRRELPKVGASVLTKEGRGKVLSQEILANELLIETEDSRRISIRADEVLTVLGDTPPEAPSEAPARQGEQGAAAEGDTGVSEEKEDQGKKKSGGSRRRRGRGRGKKPKKPDSGGPGGGDQ